MVIMARLGGGGKEVWAVYGKQIELLKAQKTCYHTPKNGADHDRHCFY
jgi:hypothetical protein